MTPETTTSAAPAVDAGPAAIHVLLIDDDPSQLELTSAILTAYGYTVTAVGAAAGALDACRRRRPDVVVSDVVMPDLDGFSLCSLLRGVPELAGVPVMLTSAHFSGAEDRKLAECAGASAFVERTPMFEAELHVLQRVLREGPPPQSSASTLSHQYTRRMATRLSEFLARTRDAEIRYRTLFDHANDMVSLLDTDGVILEVNRKCLELLGYPPQRLVGHHIREFAAPGHQDTNVQVYRGLAAAGAGQTPPVALATMSGSVLYVVFSNNVVELDDKRVVVAIGRDVTAEVDADRRLEASERRYRSLVDHIPDVVWMATLDGKIHFVSQTVEAVSGFSTDEIVAASPELLCSRIHPEDVDRARQAYAQVASSGRYLAEFRWQRKDGAWIWVRARGVTIRTDDGAVLVEGTSADVTELKRLEEQVRQSQKMEAIGRLTGGIAHDFNNILAIVLGNSRMLLDELPVEDSRRADVEAIIEAGERAASLTQQLLVFSRRQVVRPVRVDLNALVGNLDKMLRRAIGEDIDFSVKLADGPCTVLADPGELDQVVLNLVVNARDAMPSGGTLSIETAVVELDDAYAAAHADVIAGRHMMLSVTDNGCGMDEDTRRRIFEPFFTTKGRDKGTGLGLSTCYGIVKRSHGHIAVYSELARGTAFKVYLPCVDACPAPSITPAAPHVDVAGTETVLVVEDDDQLRSTIGRALAGYGYDVLDAPDGQHAIDLCEQRAGPMHLVLIDMVMPGLSGPETAARIQPRLPNARIVFMSGYSDHALFQNGWAERGVQFIQKPFMPQALAAKVREVLDGR